jgi:biopolymer transport protein ExbD
MAVLPMSQEKTRKVTVNSSATIEPTAEVMPLDDEPVTQTEDISPPLTFEEGSDAATAATTGRPPTAPPTITARLLDGALFDVALFVSALVVTGIVQATTTSPLAAVHMVQASSMDSVGTIAVRVDADNGLMVDDQPLTDVAALARRIAQRRGELGGDAQVVLTADREVLFRVVAQALAAVHESGASTCRLSVGTVSGKGG